MRMRTSKALATAAALLLLGTAGCTDLVVEPKSTVTEANIFNDPSSYRAFIAKVYTGLTVTGQQGPNGQPDLFDFDEGFSSYVRVYWEAEELPTDEAVIGWNDTGIEELNTQLWGVTNGFVNIMYYRIFFQIGMANEFLRQTTDAKLASRGHDTPALLAEVATYRAEARFLRALSYWHGLDLFGNIPLVTDADVLGTIPNQADRAEIYEFVVNELNEIRDELPAVGAANYGRATGPAATMLLAKLYLNAGVYTGTPNYSGALTEASAVIANSAYSLDNNYQDIFLADNHTSPEIVFSVPQDGLKTQTWGGMTFLIHASCGESLMQAADYGIDGCWWGLRLKPPAATRYAAGDKRDDFFFSAGQTLEVTTIGDFKHGIAAPKFRNVTSTGAQGSHPTFPDTDYPMFRLADAYLIYAEAHVRGGGGSLATAVGYINALRQRAYGNTTGNITSGQLTLDFILDERGRELLWEGHRRTDLVRYGRFTGNTYVWAWKGGVLAGTGTGAHLDLYPLPGNELIANPNLTQNPGY